MDALGGCRPRRSCPPPHEDGVVRAAMDYISSYQKNRLILNLPGGGAHAAGRPLGPRGLQITSPVAWQTAPFIESIA